MPLHRTILAVIVALAVAIAPIASGLAVATVSEMPAMVDCHGKSAPDHSCCDKAKCPDGCGVKCCKLIGVITEMPVVSGVWSAAHVAADPQKPPDWRLRPRPPPPRS